MYEFERKKKERNDTSYCMHTLLIRIIHNVLNLNRGGGVGPFWRIELFRYLSCIYLYYFWSKVCEDGIFKWYIGCFFTHKKLNVILIIMSWKIKAYVDTNRQNNRYLLFNITPCQQIHYRWSTTELPLFKYKLVSNCKKKDWKYITCKERTFHLVRNIATFCVHTEARIDACFYCINFHS